MRRSGTLQIRRPSDHAMALRALELVVSTLREGPGWISDPVPTPEGPILTFELKPGKRAVRARDIPELVLSAAEEVGLESGTIDFLVDAAAWEGCEALGRYAIAVGALASSRVTRHDTHDVDVAVLREWTEITASFMAERCDDVFLFIGGTGMRLPAKGLGTAVLGIITAGSSVQLVATEGMPRPAASITGTLAPAVGLGCASGNDMTPSPLLLEEGWQILRDHAATLNYAFFEPWSTWNGVINLHHHPRPWLDAISPRHRPDYSLADWIQSAVSDETVLEPFPRQILGPGHLARLGGTVLPTTVELEAGRVEVTLGDPADWSLIYGPLFATCSDEPPIAYAEGASLLKPCLISGEEGRALLRAKER